MTTNRFRWRLLLALPFVTLTANASPFVVHEWGTFTSFQNANGSSLYGLQRGDEPLPSFVYLRNPTSPDEPSHGTGGCRRNSYSCDWAPINEPAGEHRLGVNQRMETPVIYFHSDKIRDVSVTVDFPQGIITEWYPRASAFRPAINQVNQIADGSMTWNVRVQTDRMPLPYVPANSIWAPSRDVNANDISTGGENERLIFYRGVGDFGTNFFSQSLDDSFSLSNSDQTNDIPEVLYIHVTDKGGYVRSLGRLGAGQMLAAKYADTSLHALRPMREYIAEASGLVQQAIQNAGLYEDEARALVNTWKHAYFETRGERFLFVLPRAQTDQILPMTITPAPDQLERVLVGRVEVMNVGMQDQIFDSLFTSAQAEPQQPVYTEGFGPFAEQILRLAFARSSDRMAEQFAQAPGEVEREAIRVRFDRSADYIRAAISTLEGQ